MTNVKKTDLENILKLVQDILDDETVQDFNKDILTHFLRLDSDFHEASYTAQSLKALFSKAGLSDFHFRFLETHCSVKRSGEEYIERVKLKDATEDVIGNILKNVFDFKAIKEKTPPQAFLSYAQNPVLFPPQTPQTEEPDGQTLRP